MKQQKTNTFLSQIPLKAASLLYDGATSMRNFAFDRLPCLSTPPKMPTVSVGGIRAGGSGKTPMVDLVARLLLARGHAVAVVSRGYRRLSKEMVVVPPGANADWRLCGDEPSMLYERLSGIWLGIGANRVRSIEMLSGKMGSSAVAVLDDAFQHRRCRRDLDIVTVHPELFSDSMLPQGRLRERLSGLRRAHCILIIGDQNQHENMHQTLKEIRDLWPNALSAIVLREPGEWHGPDGQRLSKPPCQRPKALCGIARPDHFAASLKEFGLGPVPIVSFPDHYRYSSSDFDHKLTGDCDGILTTEKDMIKLRALKLVNCPNIWYLTLKLRFAEVDQQGRFEALLSEKIPL